MKPGGITDNHHLHNRQGFTLFEIFLTLLILAIAITPMVNAFAPALLSSGQEEEQTVLTGHVRQTMNGLLDMDFATLDANKTTPGVLITILGNQAATDTVVSITDVSGTDAQGHSVGGLLELKVTLKNVTLQTFKAAR